MTKQEIIQQTYGKYWDDNKEWIDENGFFNGEAEHLIKLKTCLFRDNNIEITIIDKIQFVRPKTLKNIENNNGWIKYENNNVVSLPKDYLVFTDKGKIYTSNTYFKFSSINQFQIITHFKKVEIPEPPLY